MELNLMMFLFSRLLKTFLQTVFISYDTEAFIVFNNKTKKITHRKMFY